MMESLLLIKDKAKEILEKYNQTSVPIDVKKICKKENIQIKLLNLSELEETAKRPISGLIFVDPESKFKAIYVNSTDKEPRRNFTIAHELGHFYMHIKDDEDGVIVSFRGLKNEREREADIFASELLMPRDLIIEEYNNLPYPTASYLASKFNVSKQAMEIKLNELGLNYIG